MTHPIKGLLDHIWNSGHTPKLLVNARSADVVIPENIRKQWGSRLPIDLNAADPLHIEFDEIGVHADLAFNHNVMRCTLPWARIYVVINRDTGESWTIPAHVPDGVEVKAVPPKEESSPPRADETKRQGLRYIKGGKSN